MNPVFIRNSDLASIRREGEGTIFATIGVTKPFSDWTEIRTSTDNGLLTIAAFISAGMHTNIERLDIAKESLGTGCIELVSAAVSYTDYLEALYAAGLELIGGVPGVFEYEVAEPFGTWYVDTILDSMVEPVLPDNESVCAKLVGLVLSFYSNKDRAVSKVDELFTALQVVPKPAMPQI